LYALPRHFEPNRGQAPPSALYLARNGPNLALFSAAGPTFAQGGARISMMLDGASHRAPRAESPLPGRSNYFLPAARIAGVPHFSTLRYAGIYPGIDLVFHGDEYDFTLAPHVDPRAIRMRFDGTARVDHGELIVKSGGFELRHRAPVAYQEFGGARHAVSAAYRLFGGIATFDVGAYDPSHPLVIDPVLVYSTYFGGSGADDASAVLLDASGNAILVGSTTSTDLPVTAGAYQKSVKPSITLGYVAKLDAKSNVLFASYFAAASDTTLAGAALDAAGNILITGFTVGNGTIAATSGAYQTAGGPGFVAKLSSAGDKLLFASTFNAYPAAIAQDPAGNLYVTGNTFGNLQTTPGVLQSAAGGGTCSDTPSGGGVCSDVFVLKLSADASKLLYATYLGGELEDTGRAIAVDTAGNAYVTGDTLSTKFPLVNAAQTRFVPLQQVFGSFAVGHAFVAKLSPDASKLLYSTYLGGSAADVGNGIAIDPAGNAYVAGATSSPDLPGTASYAGPVYDPTDPSTDGDAFAAKYSPQGALLWTRLVGGAESDYAVALSLDSSGNLYIAGNTASADFPTTAESIPSCRRTMGPFVAELDPGGKNLLRSTKVGGIGFDLVGALTLDRNSGIVYLAGAAASRAFFAGGTAAQRTYSGGDSDAFVAKIGWNGSPGAYVACVLNAASFAPGNQAFFPTGAVAPGEIVSIFGVGLGPAEAVTSPVLTGSGTVATTAGGTQVLFDGIAAPLLYVGQNQINAVVPYEVKSGGTNPVTQMTVQTAAGSFGPVTMPVSAAVPGVFTYHGAGIGQAAALNQDGSFNTVDNPAIRGQIVTFFATGAGLLSPPAATGSITPGSPPFAAPQLPISVMVRGANAQIQYVGAAPGYISGLLQINVYVPTDINFGSDVPLLVNFGSYSSQFQVSLAVK
jgi:uncharacterized protein (TIGR03437 family)